MSRSLWVSTAEQLLQRTSSADPTPGGGAIAAVAAAFGVGLIQMAIEVTLAPQSEQGTGPDPALLEGRARAIDLQAQFVEAADADAAEFDALMAAYRLPKDDERQIADRGRAIDDATVSATYGPLRLAESAIAGVSLGAEMEPLVKPTITSDVQAGCDLLRGAALAALRTSDINLTALERREHAEAGAIRQRRDAVHAVASLVVESP